MKYETQASSKRLLLSARCLRHLYAFLGAALRINELLLPRAQYSFGTWFHRNAHRAGSAPMPMLCAGIEARLV
jgi:hypothetical protein